MFVASRSARAQLRLLWPSVVLICCLSACSADGVGDNVGGAGLDATGGGGQTCTGAFCLEDDVRIELNPTSLTFLDLEPGESAEADVQIRNVGSRGVLHVTAMTFIQGSDEFSVVGPPVGSPLPPALPPGQAATIRVRYAPKAAGNKVAQLVLDNDSTEAALQHAVVPIAVHAGSGALKLLPEAIDFGGVEKGVSVDKTAKLLNLGTKAVKVESISLAAEGNAAFSLPTVPALPLQLEPNATTEITVRCNPSVDGTAETVLRVGYDGDRVAEAPVLAETPGAKILVTPASLNFGVLEKDASATRTFTVYSNGASALTVQAIDLSPLSKVKAVSHNAQLPFTLAPGDSKAIDVTLKVDTDLGSTDGIVASLVVASNAGNQPTVALPLLVTGKPCVQEEASSTVEAVAIGGQVDIVVAIDTSGSMKDEAKAVQQNLNAFAQIISGKKIDVHVVLLADGFGLCVPPPLGGPGCTDATSFRHVKVKVDSTDALEKIVSSYPLYKDFLRVGAARHFIVVTDDKSDKDAAWFKSKIAALGPPGFPDGFTLHGIVSWSDQLAYLPCLGGAGWGGVYLDLAKQTNGEVASICTANWASVFNKIGTNVVSTVKTQCLYPLPLGKDGKVVSPEALDMTWSASDGVQKPAKKVSGPDACPTDSVAWHVDNANAPTAAVLCPSTCDAMAGKTLHFHFGCGG